MVGFLQGQFSASGRENMRLETFVDQDQPRRTDNKREYLQQIKEALKGKFYAFGSVEREGQPQWSRVHQEMRLKVTTG